MRVGQFGCGSLKRQRRAIFGLRIGWPSGEQKGVAERESNLEIRVVEFTRRLVLLDGRRELAALFERGAQQPLRSRVLRRQVRLLFQAARPLRLDRCRVA